MIPSAASKTSPPAYPHPAVRRRLLWCLFWEQKRYRLPMCQIGEAPLKLLLYTVVVLVKLFERKGYEITDFLRAWWFEHRLRHAQRHAESREIFALTADPNAAPERLADAARNVVVWTHPYLPALLAAHPNTPPEALLELLIVSHEPAASGLFINPILPLLALECPDFASRQLNGKAVETFLRRSDCPPALVRLLRTYPDPILVWEAETHCALTDSGTPRLSPEEAFRSVEEHIRRTGAAEAETHWETRYGYMVIMSRPLTFREGWRLIHAELPARLAVAERLLSRFRWWRPGDWLIRSVLRRDANRLVRALVENHPS
jgi:hypothetical protein